MNKIIAALGAAALVAAPVSPWRPVTAAAADFMEAAGSTAGAAASTAAAGSVAAVIAAAAGAAVGAMAAPS